MNVGARRWPNTRRELWPAETPSRLWMNRHAFGANAAQTREPEAASVTAEGGGTTTPTLGGGFWFSREQSPVAGEAAR